MKPKAAIKIAVDVGMTLALLFLMGYHLWGETFHEWAGTSLFVLFLAHHILNGNWHQTLSRGKYSVIRTVTLVIDILVLVSMLIQMVSGIMMSRHVFAFLPLGGGMALARRFHLLSAYWGFMLMSLHLGLHWNMILGMTRKAAGIKNESKSRRMISFLAGLTIAGFGAGAFIRRDFPTYLLLKSEFVSLDYSEPKLLFILDFLALMGSCIFIAHYGAKLLQKVKEHFPRFER